MANNLLSAGLAGKSTVFEFGKLLANKDHSTIKSIGLYLLLAQYHSNPGDLIYEPFCGSGTTMITAEQLGRICYAIELQPNVVNGGRKVYHLG